MSSNNSKLITLEKKSPSVRYAERRDPQTRNPIYQKDGNYGCPFCPDKKGRKKIFKNLNCLWKHFTYHHPYEQTSKELVMSLADLIIKGVLL